MCHNGLGTKKDHDKAIQIYSSILLKGGYTWCTLGKMYHSSVIQFQDFSKARVYYRRTIGKNKSHAFRGLGLLYEHGDSIDKDYKKAFNYYELSQREGKKGAYYNTALLCYYGKGVSQDFLASFECFERVVEDDCKEHNTYVLVEDDTDSGSLGDRGKKKYSFVPEQIIYNKAFFILAS